MDRTVSGNLARQYERQVSRVADALRKLADDIENAAPPRAGLVDGKPDYLGHARDIFHKINWGLANAPSDTMLSAAIEADRWVRSPEAD